MIEVLRKNTKAPVSIPFSLGIDDPDEPFSNNERNHSHPTLLSPFCVDRAYREETEDRAHAAE